MVIASLERIKIIMDSSIIKPEDLFTNSLCGTLYSSVRPVYPVSTLAGKKARRILLALQKICLTDSRCPRNLLEVSDCESPPPARPSAPDFMGLFMGGSRDRVLSDVPLAGSSPPLHSTVLQPRRNQNRYYSIFGYSL